jgi:hypothetical protein
MNRQQLLQRLDTAWEQFKESYAGLSNSQLAEPGVMGNWSVKDILAHVTTWEEEALKALPIIAAGGRPPQYSKLYGGIDAFIQGIPAEQFTRETRFRRRLRLDTYSHYPLHAQAIREWRDPSG